MIRKLSQICNECEFILYVGTWLRTGLTYRYRVDLYIVLRGLAMSTYGIRVDLNLE